jgi:hypothetical protein
MRSHAETAAAWDAMSNAGAGAAFTSHVADATKRASFREENMAIKGGYEE